MIPTLILLLLLPACGYQTAEVKEYRLFVDSVDPEIQDEFRSLIDSFNYHAGFYALHYVTKPEQSNSQVILTQGLQARDGKVGWGQWQRETFADSNLLRFTGGGTPKQTFVYSMRIEFDKEYFMERMRDDASVRRIQLFKLFSHEAGHGLQMDHDEDNPASMMFPDISGEKDVPQFFGRVRGYFGR